MEVSNLASGLIGSLIGAFLGATATFLGQRHLSDRELKRRRIGIVRALLGELEHNGSRAVMAAVARRTTGGYSSAVWDKAMFEIAQFDNRQIFGALLGVYGQLSFAVEASEAVRSPADGYYDTLRIWHDAVRKAYNLLLTDPRFREATSGRNELTPFDAEAESLRQRLNRTGVTTS